MSNPAVLDSYVKISLNISSLLTSDLWFCSSL
uniref:Uncharacterized protein n=1 Tax=Anguilla anguilla TaxID=7936 RepID=A0A0E9QBP5_ANGAN